MARRLTPAERARQRPPDIGVYTDPLSAKLLRILDPDYDAQRVRDLGLLAEHAANIHPGIRKDLVETLERVGERFLGYAAAFRPSYTWTCTIEPDPRRAAGNQLLTGLARDVAVLVGLAWDLDGREHDRAARWAVRAIRDQLDQIEARFAPGPRRFRRVRSAGT